MMRRMPRAIVLAPVAAAVLAVSACAMQAGGPSGPGGGVPAESPAGTAQPPPPASPELPGRSCRGSFISGRPFGLWSHRRTSRLRQGGQPGGRNARAPAGWGRIILHAVDQSSGACGSRREQPPGRRPGTQEHSACQRRSPGRTGIRLAPDRSSRRTGEDLQLRTPTTPTAAPRGSRRADAPCAPAQARLLRLGRLRRRCGHLTASPRNIARVNTRHAHLTQRVSAKDSHRAQASIAILYHHSETDSTAGAGS